MLQRFAHRSVIIRGRNFARSLLFTLYCLLAYIGEKWRERARLRAIPSAHALHAISSGSFHPEPLAQGDSLSSADSNNIDFILCSF